MLLPRSEDCETTIKTLRALPTTGVKRRHVVDSGAAPSIPGQTADVRSMISAFVIHANGLSNAKGCPEHCLRDATKTRQVLWVRGSG
jgi:hypothetical protein